MSNMLCWGQNDWKWSEKWGLMTSACVYSHFKTMAVYYLLVWPTFFKQTYCKC